MSDAKPQFQCGDVVALRSGGPSMTVMKADRGDGIAECRWFGGSELHYDSFAPAELRLAAVEVTARAVMWSPFGPVATAD